MGSLRRKCEKNGIKQKNCAYPVNVFWHHDKSGVNLKKDVETRTLFIYLFQDIPYGSLNACGVIFGICIL